MGMAGMVGGAGGVTPFIFSLRNFMISSRVRTGVSPLLAASSLNFICQGGEKFKPMVSRSASDLYWRVTQCGSGVGGSPARNAALRMIICFTRRLVTTASFVRNPATLTTATPSLGRNA